MKYLDRRDADKLIFWAAIRMDAIVKEIDAKLATLPASTLGDEKRRRHLVIKRLRDQFCAVSVPTIAYLKSNGNSEWMAEEIKNHMPFWVKELLDEWSVFMREALDAMMSRENHPAQSDFSTLLLCHTILSEIHEIFGEKAEEAAREPAVF